MSLGGITDVKVFLLGEASKLEKEYEKQRLRDTLKKMYGIGGFLWKCESFHRLPRNLKLAQQIADAYLEVFKRNYGEKSNWHSNHLKSLREKINKLQEVQPNLKTIFEKIFEQHNWIELGRQAERLSNSSLRYSINQLIGQIMEEAQYSQHRLVGVKLWLQMANSITGTEAPKELFKHLDILISFYTSIANLSRDVKKWYWSSCVDKSKMSDYYGEIVAYFKLSFPFEEEILTSAKQIITNILSKIYQEDIGWEKVIPWANLHDLKMEKKKLGEYADKMVRLLNFEDYQQQLAHQEITSNYEDVFLNEFWHKRLGAIDRTYKLSILSLAFGTLMTSTPNFQERLFEGTVVQVLSKYRPVQRALTYFREELSKVKSKKVCGTPTGDLECQIQWWRLRADSARFSDAKELRDQYIARFPLKFELSLSREKADVHEFFHLLKASTAIEDLQTGKHKTAELVKGVLLSYDFERNRYYISLKGYFLRWKKVCPRAVLINENGERTELQKNTPVMLRPGSFKLEYYKPHADHEKTREVKENRKTPSCKIYKILIFKPKKRS